MEFRANGIDLLRPGMCPKPSYRSEAPWSLGRKTIANVLVTPFFDGEYRITAVYRGGQLMRVWILPPCSTICLPMKMTRTLPSKSSLN